MDTNALVAQWRAAQEIVGRLGKVFALGCPKSGTTWLENLLDGHPEMVVKGEGAFAYQLIPLLSQAFAKFNEHQKHLAEYARLRDVDLLLTARTIVDGQFARYIEASGCDLSKLRIVGDKTPQHTIGMVALSQLYPGAKFVHIIRDPRDAATSAWHHFGKNDKRSFEDYVRYFITQVWPVNVGGARKAAANLPGKYLEVRYEDLHTDETAQVKRILDFLGVDSSDATVAQCVESGSFKRRSGGRERGDSNSSHFYRNGQVADWMNHLPVELAESCCSAVAPLMSACGYDPSCAATA